MKTVQMNIDKFLGLHSDALGDTELKIGELSSMQNFKITEGYNLEKRSGYTAQLTTATAHAIQGQWYGKIGATTFHIFASNGHVYKNDGDGTVTDLGTLTDAKTNFFYFSDAVYIQNGTQYKKWTGTDSIADVVGYTPLVMNSRNMGGSSTGTAQEGLNLISQQRRMKFNGVSAQTVAYLVETAVTSVDKVYVGGVLKTVTTDYTVNLTDGTVTFGTAPAVGVDNVEIYWTKGASVYTTISRNTNSKAYGGKNDNRVFLYGYDNITYYSGLADGVPSAEYFPVLNFIKIGNNNTIITDLSKQYDRLVIFKEDNTWWTNYEYTSVIGVEFPVYPLNDAIGCSYRGTSQLIGNNPFVVFGKKVYQFVASNVRDERNAQYMSMRIQPLLDEETLTSLITFDNEKDGEYWMAIGKEIYIYNYSLDIWYYYLLNDSVSSICKTDYLTIGTSTGQIMKFDNAITDNLVTINSFAKTGYLDYGLINTTKFVNYIWIAIKPENKTRCDFYFQIDGQAEKFVKTISYNNLSFALLDFSSMTFDTDYNPRSKRLKPKAKKFVYIKFIFKNNVNEKLAILNVKAPSILGGISK